MTDTIWLLWNRALVDYAKAVSMWSLTRVHRAAGAKQPATTGQPEPEDLK